jgi:hypothetical protein
VEFRPSNGQIDVKTPESERLMHIDTEVLGELKTWK